MYIYRLQPGQIEIVAATLRRHADSSIAEYISSIQGHGSLPFAGLVSRFELLNEVARSVPDPGTNLPTIPPFDLAEELRKAFARFKISTAGMSIQYGVARPLGDSPDSIPARGE